MIYLHLSRRNPLKSTRIPLPHSLTNFTLLLALWPSTCSSQIWNLTDKICSHKSATSCFYSMKSTNRLASTGQTSPSTCLKSLIASLTRLVAILTSNRPKGLGRYLGKDSRKTIRDKSTSALISKPLCLKSPTTSRDCEIEWLQTRSF